MATIKPRCANKRLHRIASRPCNRWALPLGVEYVSKKGWEKMKISRILCIVGILTLLFALPSKAQERVSFTQPVTCKFQYGQYMGSQKAETNTQKSVLEWNFIDLFGSQPHFLSGGNSGAVSVHRHETSNGVSIWLRQGNGAHLFSIWPDGTAFWSKHNDIFGSKATQQFRGTCTNVLRTD